MSIVKRACFNCFISRLIRLGCFREEGVINGLVLGRIILNYLVLVVVWSEELSW
jgi:hypothetical protein